MTEVEAHNGCPVVTTDYRSDRGMSEIAELLNEDREKAPILRNESPGTPFWMVTRYDLAVEAAQMADVFGTEVITALTPEMGIELRPHNVQGEEHLQLRKVLNRMFSPAAIRKLEPLVRQRCVELIEGFAGRGSCDVVADFAFLYPTEMFLATLNLPMEDGMEMIHWVDIFINAAAKDGDKADIARASASINTYFNDAIDDRIANPRDPDEDFISRLLVAELDGEPMPREQIVTVCLSLMLAGLETTRAALGYIFHHLATHPDDRRRIVEDPALIPKAVEELLRLYPIVFQGGRLVKEDVEFHGCPMKKGDVLWVGFGQANADPRKFDEPDAFQFDRANVANHLAFGAGPHRCLGMHLARHELIIAMEEWHRRIPDYELVPDADLRERGGQLLLEALPLRWSVDV
jgi:cytochrome P450